MKEIFARRSIRTYQDIPVEREKIEQLLRAAMQAPSAKNQQPWEFLVIEEKSMLAKLVNVSPYTNPVGKAAAAIVVLANTIDLAAPTYWPQDCAAATQNILLEATSLELGAVWMGIHSNPEAEATARELLELPRYIEPFCLIAVGYPAQGYINRSIRHDPEKIHYGTY